MKIVMGGFAAILLAGIGWSAAADAQGLPQGSYLSSCNGARIEGDTLVARCRAPGGGEQRSALAGVHRCVGDIGNNNGHLQCTFGGPGRAQVVPAPGYGVQGYGSSFGERCWSLRRDGEQLRARLDREWNPLERARMEGQLSAIRAQEERCRY